MAVGFNMVLFPTAGIVVNLFVLFTIPQLLDIFERYIEHREMRFLLRQAKEGVNRREESHFEKIWNLRIHHGIYFKDEDIHKTHQLMDGTKLQWDELSKINDDMW